jgi:hypothetical protein
MLLLGGGDGDGTIYFVEGTQMQTDMYMMDQYMVTGFIASLVAFPVFHRHLSSSHHSIYI